MSRRLSQPEALRQLHRLPDFRRRSWADPADPAFISVTMIERSVALLARELAGVMLDVGCGQQPYAMYFPHVQRIWASDYNPRRGVVQFVSSATILPVKDVAVDSILCTEVLEHVPDPRATWREFFRVLRPGGKVLLTTPMYWPSHEVPFDFYRYPEHGLVFLAERAGFTVEALYPRGGAWAFLGQVISHVIPQWLRFRWQRRLLNALFLSLDRWRCNPSLTAGWTILAAKPASPTTATASAPAATNGAGPDTARGEAVPKGD